MINIKELSVGNWVKFPHGIDKIDELCRWANSAATATNRPVSTESLEPIPITPEILEKNGWKYHAPLSDYPADYVTIIDEYQIMATYLDEERLWCFTIHSDNEKIRTINQFNIHYVHQLQNALTLCGIIKNIGL